MKTTNKKQDAATRIHKAYVNFEINQKKYPQTIRKANDVCTATMLAVLAARSNDPKCIDTYRFLQTAIVGSAEMHDTVSVKLFRNLQNVLADEIDNQVKHIEGGIVRI